MLRDIFIESTYNIMGPYIYILYTEDLGIVAKRVCRRDARRKRPPAVHQIEPWRIIRVASVEFHSLARE